MIEIIHFLNSNILTFGEFLNTRIGFAILVCLLLTAISGLIALIIRCCWREGQTTADTMYIPDRFQSDPWGNGR